MGFQEYITNQVEDLNSYETFCGLISFDSSRYTKSPPKWNAVFEKFGISAKYVAFDTPEKNLENLFNEFRKNDKLRGLNVTVPHKENVIPYLDEIEKQAIAYNAVNTIHKVGDKLNGYNTDGIGEVRNLEESFGSLKGKKILQIGAGGAGNAISYAIVDKGADIVISNRSIENAEKLANGLEKYSNRKFVFGGEDIIPEYVSKVDLILNVSTKGQSGKLGEYSALAPASKNKVHENIEESLRLVSMIPVNVGFADVVYSPEKSVFLKHGEESGHRILNGENMLVYQAVEGIMRLYKDELAKAGATKEQVTQIMKNAK